MRSRHCLFLLLPSLFLLFVPQGHADPIDDLAKTSPLLANTLQGDPEIREALKGAQGRKALERIVEFARSENPDVREAMEIICRPVPDPPTPRTIRLDGEADDWSGAETVSLGQPSPAAAANGSVLSFFAAAADRDNLYVAIRFAKADFLGTGGRRVVLDLDVVAGPALDCRIEVSGGALATKIERPGVEKEFRAEGLAVRYGDLLEVGLPLKAMAGDEDIKPILSVRASTDLEYSRASRHQSDFAFVAYPGARRDAWCSAYARSLFWLCHDAEVRPDDRVALAIAVCRAIYWHVGDEKVREQTRKDAAEVLGIAREIVEWQEARQTKSTLDDYPFDALIAWAAMGVSRVGTRSFGMYEPGKPPSLERYLWISVRPENLHRLRKMAEENDLIDPDVSVMATKIDKWAKERQHYRVDLDEMKRRTDLGMMKRETYQEAVEDAKKGVDTALKLDGEGVYYGTMNSANAVLKLYDMTGNFYGNCSDHAMFCMAMYSAVGIAPIRFYRMPSRQKAIDHVWPGYYDPVSRRWGSPQKGRLRSHSCAWFVLWDLPVFIDTFCLHPLQLSAADVAERRGDPVIEVTRQYLTAMLERGIDGGEVRDHILTPRRRTFLPKVSAPKPNVISPGPPLIRVGVFADEKASDTCVRKSIEALNGASDISAAWFVADDMKSEPRRDCDVFLFTGGSSRQSQVLGEGGCALVKSAVEKGKGYVGVCAGAHMGAIGWDWCEPLRLVAARTNTKHWNLGVGTAELETAQERAAPFWLFYENGPVFTPTALGGLGVAAPLARYVSDFKGNNAPDGTMRGGAAILASRYGKGRVVLLGPHPEMTPGMEHLLVDAVRWAAGKRGDEEQINWDAVFGADAVRPRPIRPYVRLERGRGEDWRGIAVGAPRATPDWFTGDMALALSERFGVPSVSAFRMQDAYMGRLFDVCRPSERVISYWRIAEARSYSREAREVYDAYQLALFDAGGVGVGPLDLYVELGGHSLRLPKADDGKTAYREVIEATATGFSNDQLREIEKVYGELVEKASPQIKAPLHFRNLSEDRTYEIEGQKAPFEFSTADAEETGAMRPGCAKRSLFLALPRAARFDGVERLKYVAVLGRLLEHVRKMIRDAPLANAPGENLIRNGGFEREIDSDWFKRTPDDEKRKLARTAAAAHSGKWSLAITNSSDVLSRWRQGNDGSIRLTPGGTFTLSGWIKSKIAGEGEAFLSVFMLSEADQMLSVRHTRPVVGESDWTRVMESFDVPEEMTHCAVYLELRGSGEAWFDDIVLEDVSGPKPQPARDVVLVTDLAEDDPMVVNLKALCPGRLTFANASEWEKALTPDKEFAIVVLRSGVKPSGLRYETVKEFARKGGAVVMDLVNYGEAAGLKVERRWLAGLPGASAVFQGKSERCRINVYCLDDVRSNGSLYLEVAGDMVGRWALDAERINDRQSAAPRVFASGEVNIRKGETIRLGASPAGRESCAVDRIEFAPRAGEPTVVEAEQMSLSGYSVSDDVAPFAKGIKTSPGALEERRIRIDEESDVTKGFRAGDRVPWFGGEFAQSLCGDRKGIRRLASAEDGAGVVVEEKVGDGRIIGMDLLGIGEPVLGRPGSYNKYVFLSNAIGRGVGWGEFFEKRLSYADFVADMKALANTYQGIALKEEGLACVPPGRNADEYRIYSLNFGDVSKPMFFMYACVHGSEWEPAHGLLNLARKIAASPSACGLDLDRYGFKILPILNPSGYDLRTRKNANGVDINRNSPHAWETFVDNDGAEKGKPYDEDAVRWKGKAPFSEPESRAYKNIVDSNDIYCLIEFHSPLYSVVVPSTARRDNDAKVAAVRQLFRTKFADRYVFEFPEVPGVRQYRLGPSKWMGRTPYLLQYGAKDRYGLLVETPGCYSGAHGAVMQTDIVATACMSAIEVYGGLRP